MKHLLALEENELAAGDRVLNTILLSQDPAVRTLVEASLAGWPGLDFRRFCQHVHAATQARMPDPSGELLEALKAVVAVADRRTVEFDRAQAAIAKAEEQ